MKIAAAQIACAPGEVGANLRKIREFAARAKKGGAELIVFPEMSDTGYSMPVIKQHASSWSEGAVPRLEQIAEELSIGIISGVSEREGEKIYNAQVFINSAVNWSLRIVRLTWLRPRRWMNGRFSLRATNSSAIRPPPV